MDYLKEILAFEQWLETHYLPISPQLLWYKLVYLCNRSGWSEWVTVDNLRLMAAMQMGREATLIKARDELIKAGLIEYRRGKKGCPNQYRLISLTNERNTFKSVVQSEAQRVVKGVVKGVVESEVKGVVESVAIYKHKQKQNENIDTPISPSESFSDFWEAYPNKQRRFQAEKAYVDVLLSGNYNAEELTQSAANYAEYIQLTGSRSYFPNNFLEKAAFEDYLPGNYKKPEPQASARKNWKAGEQRNYDFGALEQELLANQGGES